MWKRQIRKMIQVGLLCCGIPASIMGCQGKQEQVQEEKKEIVLWHYWDSQEMFMGLERAVNRFNGSQQEYELTMQYVPDEDFKKRLALSMADGIAPDLALVDSSDFMFFHNMVPFAELTDQVKGLGEYDPVSLSSCSKDNHIYGMPMGINCLAFYYNKDYLEEIGREVPTDWEELMEAAVDMTNEQRYGFEIPAVQSEESMFTVLPMLWSRGASVYDLESEGSLETFSWIESIVEQGAMSRQTTDMTGSDVAERFGQGTVGMAFLSTAAADYISQEYPNLNFGVTMIPSQKQSATVLGGEVMAVKAGENQKGAILFLNYLDEHLEEYIESFGLFAAREELRSRQFQEDDVKREYHNILKTGRTRDFTVNWPRTSQVVIEALEAVIQGQGKPDEILKEAESQLQEIRKETE